jgi:hypothetical protein
MSVTINWDNNYTGLESEVRVYRDTSPIDTMSPPAILATLATGSTSYFDGLTSAGTTYYYRVSVIVNGQEIFGTADWIVTDGEWNPLDLFAGTEIGFWLDASDTSTMRVLNNPIDGVDGQQVTRHIVKGQLANVDSNFNIFGQMRLSKKANGKICTIYNAMRNYDPSDQQRINGVSTENHNPADFSLFNNCNEVLMGFNLESHSVNLDGLYRISMSGGSTRFSMKFANDGSQIQLFGRQSAAESLNSFIVQTNTTDNFQYDMINQSIVIHWKAGSGSEIDIYVNGTLIDSGTFNATLVTEFANENEENIYIGSDGGVGNTTTSIGYSQIIHCGRIGTFSATDISNMSQYLLNAKYRGV